MSRRVAGVVWIIAAMLALSASGCMTAIGNTSLWIRPAVGVAARTVENGDGEPIIMERFEPKGDSMMIMFRFSPNDLADKSTGSGIRNLPKKQKKP